ncbi:MAG: DUF131 domain-containing protein [Thermoplasmata archaeon]|nr:MAG: DUF131 domain-containing protein [Thermoplasmata archaeon]
MGFASGYELVGWDELQREFFKDSDQKGGGAGQAPPKGAKRTRIEGGGVVLLGPIPLVFGSNTKLTLILVVLTFAIMVVALMIFLM